MDLENRGELERDLKDELARLTQKQQAEFRRLLGSPPNIENVPVDFWDRVEQERQEVLAVFLMGVAMANSTRHGGSVGSISGLDQWSTGRAQAVARRYRVAAEERARKELDAGSNSRDASRGAFREDSDEGMATTETTAASVTGGEVGAAAAGLISDQDTWVLHPELSKTGPCEICAPLGGEPRSVWSRVFPLGPPAHPNCKCEIRYVRTPSSKPKQAPPTGSKNRRTSRRDSPDISVLSGDIGYVATRRRTSRPLASSIGLSVASLAALQALNGASMVKGNRLRRSGVADAFTAAQDRTVTRVLGVLPVSSSPVLYSAFGDRDSEWVKAAEGKVVTERGYLPATTQSPVRSLGRHTITIRGHKNGRHVSDVGPSVPGEVLFSPGAKFKVESKTVDGQGNISLIVMEEG